MALDGIILKAIEKNLLPLVPSKINKIQQISDDELLFNIRHERTNLKLLISCHSLYNRINITERSYKTPDSPNNFVMVLRKHIMGAIIESIEQIGLDRILKFSLMMRDEIGDYHNYFLYLELMGKYANLVLADDSGRIVDALKRIPPYENSTRTIHPGAEYTLPDPQSGKQDPFVATVFDKEESFVRQFHGFSPLLSDELHFRLRNGESFSGVMQELAESNKLYIYDDGRYHLIQLKHIDQDFVCYPLFEAFDIMYFQAEEKVRIKQQSGDIAKIIKKELKKDRNKLEKLQKTLDEAYDLDKYRVYGDLLYAYAYQFPYNQKEVVLKSFDTGEDITIPLDNKIPVKQNAKKYYQKYTKSKNAQSEVSKQIELTIDRIDYFENLEAQLKMAGVEDAIEIREELAKNGYLRKTQKNIQHKKQKKPGFMTFIVNETKIFVGKNNLQNDYITFKQAHRNDTWLHVKDLHGSHVVIESEDPDENLLRTAAMLAAYYSQGRESSSVPVNYCLIKNIKKPKNAASGFVTMSSYKTIFIDPDQSEILRLIQENLKH